MTSYLASGHVARSRMTVWLQTGIFYTRSAFEIYFQMSSIGYHGLLYQLSQKLVDLSKINQVFYTARSGGLIEEDSESYNAQVNPGDNIAVLLTKLFSDLEKQDNLGINNLEILRGLLKDVKEWSLIDKVDKFEKQRKSFITLLDKFIAKLDELDKLDELISLCADHIPEDVKSEIKDVRSLFRELEKKNRLGFERLAILKKILNEAREQELMDETTEKELLDELTTFEKKWKEEEDAERRRGKFTLTLRILVCILVFVTKQM